MSIKLWIPHLATVLTVVSVVALLLITGVVAASTVEDDPLVATSVGESIVQASHEVSSLDWTTAGASARGG